MTWWFPCVKVIEKGFSQLDQNEFVGENERRKRKDRKRERKEKEKEMKNGRK